MDLRKIKTLIDLVRESGVAELEVNEGEDHLRIVNTTAPPRPCPQAPCSPTFPRFPLRPLLFPRFRPPLPLRLPRKLPRSPQFLPASP